MNESNSIETLNKYSNLNAILLSDQTKFILNEINKTKDYFNSEIQERKGMTKKLSKYTAAFDYIDKNFIVLPETSGGINIISFASVTGVPLAKANANFNLVFCLTTGIINKLLKIIRNKKNKHEIVMLAKRKLNSIETLICQALIDLEISHEEHKTIINEKEKYEEMKENIRNIKSSDELSENSINNRENKGDV